MEKSKELCSIFLDVNGTFLWDLCCKFNEFFSFWKFSKILLKNHKNLRENTGEIGSIFRIFSLIRKFFKWKSTVFLNFCLTYLHRFSNNCKLSFRNHSPEKFFFSVRFCPLQQRLLDSINHSNWITLALTIVGKVCVCVYVWPSPPPRGLSGKSAFGAVLLMSSLATVLRSLGFVPWWIPFPPSRESVT